MSSKKILVQHVPSVGFFIHRSRVQKLYRQFLRVCDTDTERQQVRMEFRINKMDNPAKLKEAEAILKRLQLARGPNSSHRPIATDDDRAEPVKVEWPWQRPQ